MQFVISFLTSAEGPLQPTARIAYSDLKIGVPSVLLCVEMSFFAVLHLFAFPWQEYTLRHQNAAFKAEPYAPDPLSSNQQGAEHTYHGGRFGLIAIAEAFNPWDIVKASARGFRWLFVGRRKRFDDPSYQSHLQPNGNGMPDRPSITVDPPADAEMKPLYASSGDRGRAHMDSDMAQLLANAETAPSSSPGRQTGWAHESRGYDHQDTGYHSQARMPSAAEYGGRDGSKGNGVGVAYSEDDNWRH